MRGSVTLSIAVLVTSCVGAFAPGQPPSSAAASDGAPSADEVMASAVRAMGGEDAIGRINTLRTVMDMTMQGMTVQLDSSWSRKGGRLTKTISPMGTIEMCTDGTLSWMKGPGGVQLMSEQQAKEFKNQASMFMNLLEPQRTAKERLASLENTGKKTIGGAECWQLHYVNKDGDKGDLFYSIETGLPAGFETIHERNGSEQRSRMTVADWKDVEGVKFFHTVGIENSGQPGASPTMTVTKIEVNTLDEAVFAAPDEVKRLAAAQPGAATQPGAAVEITLESLTAEQRKQVESTLEGLKKSGNVATMKQMVTQLEPIVGHLPPDQKPVMQYVIQELKKEIARLGG